MRLAEYIDYKSDYHIKMFGLIEKILKTNCTEMLRLSWDSGRFLYRGISRDIDVFRYEYISVSANNDYN